MSMSVAAMASAVHKKALGVVRWFQLLQVWFSGERNFAVGGEKVTT